MSFKPEVIADSSGKWTGNGLAFETEKEAEIWVKDLSYRWLAVRETRVVPSDEPVNYRLVQSGDAGWRLEHIGGEADHAQAG